MTRKRHQNAGAVLFVALPGNAFMRPVIEKRYLPAGDTADKPIAQ